MRGAGKEWARVPARNGGAREEGGVVRWAQGADECVCVPLDRMETGTRRCTTPVSGA